MKASLQRKVVIITGASSGIGLALSHALYLRGAQVVMAARKSGLMQEEVSRWVSPADFSSGSLLAPLILQADVTCEADCMNLISTTVGQFGGIDILVNNAGISMRALFEDVSLHVLRELMEVNFWGSVNCSKYALSYLLRSGGSLAGVSSIAGFKGLPGRTGYSASKFALQGFLECVRIENRKKGLHVLIACPGFTASGIRNTARTANGSIQSESPLDESKLMTSAEVAEKIVRALIRRDRYAIMTTQGKLTVMLNKFFPAWVDAMVYKHMAREQGSPFK